MDNSSYKNAILILFLFFFPLLSFAQIREDAKKEEKLKLNSAQEMALIVVSKIDVPKIEYEPVAPPQYWTKGILTQVGFSQLSLTNWAAGGAPSLSLNTHVDAHANYKKDLMVWENRIQLSYGFIQSFDDDKELRNQFKKSDDKIQIDSKWGYALINNLYFSSLFNFRSQLTRGYDNTADHNLISKFLSPGYCSLGLGMDYKPLKNLSVNVSPLTGTIVIVTNPTLRTKYGNAEDEMIRPELGAQIKTDYKLQYKTLKLGTSLTLFSDYLNNPQNIKVYWDVDMNMALSKFLSASIRTNLIYDDNILIADKTGHEAPRVQFKEIFSISFTYTFGNYQKPK